MSYAAAFAPTWTASLLEVRGRLLELRHIDAGLGGTVVADAVGVDIETLHALEAGMVLPTELQLERLAAAGDATVEEFERALFGAIAGLLADGVHLFIPGGRLGPARADLDDPGVGRLLPPGSEATFLAGGHLLGTIASVLQQPGAVEHAPDMARRCVERLRRYLAAPDSSEAAPARRPAVPVWPQQQDVGDEALELVSALMNRAPGRQRYAAVSLARCDAPRGSILRVGDDGRPLQPSGDGVFFGPPTATSAGANRVLDLLAGALAALVEGSE